MTLYITKPNIDINIEYNLAIVYNNKYIYTKLKKNKILLDQNGTIIKDNYLYDTKDVSFEALKFLAYKIVANYFNYKFYSISLDTYGEKRDHNKRDIYLAYILPAKKSIEEFSVTQTNELLNIIEKSPEAMYNIFLDTVVYYKKQKFIKLYEEALQVLWNITYSLFKSFLYNEFDSVKYYEYIMLQYVYKFCVKYIKNYGIDKKDLDCNYNFTNSSISMIFKIFSEHLDKLHKFRHGRADINIFIQNDLDAIKNIKQFKV